MDWSQLQLTPRDSRVETVGGMKKADAWQVLTFCNKAYCAKSLLIIVRGSKPTSLQHHFKPGHHPKPLTEKTKIPFEEGRIAVDKSTHYISDYDLQGVYEFRGEAYYRLYVHNGAHAAPQGPLENRFLRALNDYVRPTENPEEALFQHGPNDDYLDKGRPKNDGIGDVFLAFLHNGDMFLIPDRDTLQAFYASRGISWNY